MRNAAPKILIDLDIVVDIMAEFLTRKQALQDYYRSLADRSSYARRLPSASHISPLHAGWESAMIGDELDKSFAALAFLETCFFHSIEAGRSIDSLLEKYVQEAKAGGADQAVIDLLERMRACEYEEVDGEFAGHEGARHFAYNLLDVFLSFQQIMRRNDSEKTAMPDMIIRSMERDLQATLQACRSGGANIVALPQLRARHLDAL